MSLVRLTLLCSLVSSVWASAVPEISNLGCGTSDPYKNLRHMANIIGEDNRKDLSKSLAEIEFSRKEAQQARSCIGNIVCWGGVGIGTSVHRPDQIITVRHIFINRDGEIEPRIKNCYFRNLINPKDKIPLDFENSTPLTGNPHKNATSDFMVVRLRRPIPGCDAYRLDISNAGAPMAVDDEIIALTAETQHAPAGGSRTEPYAQKCKVREIGVSQSGKPSEFYSDCDARHGSSGGLNIARVSGRLVVRGLFRAAGPDEYDGQEYDGYYSFTNSIGLDGEFLKDALGR